MSDNSDWRFESNPIEPGWHAIAYGWDVGEGIFVGAGYWDGAAWKDAGPQIVATYGPCESEQAANEWARSHDIW